VALKVMKCTHQNESEGIIRDHEQEGIPHFVLRELTTLRELEDHSTNYIFHT
jgi:hypothetical protein